MLSVFDPLVILSGLGVGFVVGLTGMGGGALMTPILVLLFGVEPLTAVSSDIVASMVMKPIGGAVHWRRGTVKKPLVRWLMLGLDPVGVPGRAAAAQARLGRGAAGRRQARAGRRAAGRRHRPGRQAAARRAPEARATASIPFEVKPLPTLLIGIIGGLIVGVTSVGSGSLIIIMLLMLYPRLRLSELVGTDLVQAVPLVTSAAIGHLLFGSFKFGLTASILIGSIPGVFLGARFSSRAPDYLIRPALVVVLLLSGLKLVGVPTPSSPRSRRSPSRAASATRCGPGAARAQALRRAARRRRRAPDGVPVGIAPAPRRARRRRPQRRLTARAPRAGASGLVDRRRSAAASRPRPRDCDAAMPALTLGLVGRAVGARPPRGDCGRAGAGARLRRGRRRLPTARSASVGGAAAAARAAPARHAHPAPGARRQIAASSSAATAAAARPATATARRSQSALGGPCPGAAWLADVAVASCESRDGDVDRRSARRLDRLGNAERRRHRRRRLLRAPREAALDDRLPLGALRRERQRHHLAEVARVRVRGADQHALQLHLHLRGRLVAAVGIGIERAHADRVQARGQAAVGDGSGGIGRPDARWPTISTSVLPCHMRRAASISHSITPTENRSARRSTAAHCSCSGAM